MEIGGLRKLDGWKSGDWISCLCFAGENVNSAHRPVKIKTVFLKINIFFKIF
jgi:hypothetical protein